MASVLNVVSKLFKNIFDNGYSSWLIKFINLIVKRQLFLVGVVLFIIGGVIGYIHRLIKA